MKLTNKKLTKVLTMLDSIIEDYKEKTPDRERDWRTYEQQLAVRLRKAFSELKPLVEEATKMREAKGERKGNVSLLTLQQKVLALLLKHLLGKSNRTMSFMMVILSWLNEVTVSYKTIERLYSDEQVALVLHNLHMLMLRKKGVKKADCTGDGTGYALIIKVHYASEVQKRKEKAKENTEKLRKKIKVIFSFVLMDITTRMYIGYGMSFKSEKEAFTRGMEMVRETGVTIHSIRLDKYYSTQGYAQFLVEQFKGITIYLIPKKNATIKGRSSWKNMLTSFVENTQDYLAEYYQRNQSESGFSEDKKRTGWKLGQKREERIETANKLTGIWHNLCWLGD